MSTPAAPASSFSPMANVTTGLRPHPGRAEGPGERQGGIAHDAAQDHVGLGGHDRPDDRIHVGAAEGHVLDPRHLGADAREMVLDDGVDTARPDVVRAHEEEATGAEHVVAPLHGRRDLLVGGGARVDDVGRLLEPLVGHRVDEQMVGGLDDGQDALPRRARPAAEDHAGPLVTDEPVGLAGERRPVRAAIGDHPADATAQQPAGAVDLLEREHLRIDHGGLAHGHRAGARVQDADDDRSPVDEEAIDREPPQAAHGGQSQDREPRPPAAARIDSPDRRRSARRASGVDDG
jgi:hypothetical protein